MRKSAMEGDCMNIDVFISYHTGSSQHVVEAIVNKLESKGIRCWYSEKYLTGGDYASGIMEALSKCRIFLLVLNKPASESAHVLNELEIVTDRLSKKENVIILPFHIADDEINPAAKYYIKRHHWIDAMNPPMQERIDELAGHIQRLLGVSEKPDVREETSTSAEERANPQPPAREEKPAKQLSGGWKKALIVTAIAAVMLLSQRFISVYYVEFIIWSVVAGAAALLSLCGETSQQKTILTSIALVIAVCMIPIWYWYFIMNGGRGPADAIDHLHSILHVFRFAAFAYPCFAIAERVNGSKLWQGCKTVSGISQIVAVVGGVAGNFMLRYPKGMPDIGSALLILLTTAWCIFAGITMMKVRK